MASGLANDSEVQHSHHGTIHCECHRGDYVRSTGVEAAFCLVWTFLSPVGVRASELPGYVPPNFQARLRAPNLPAGFNSERGTAEARPGLQAA